MVCGLRPAQPRSASPTLDLPTKVTLRVKLLVAHLEAAVREQLLGVQRPEELFQAGRTERGPRGGAGWTESLISAPAIGGSQVDHCIWVHRSRFRRSEEGKALRKLKADQGRIEQRGRMTQEATCTRVSLRCRAQRFNGPGMLMTQYVRQDRD